MQALIRSYLLGAWVTLGDGALVANHIPFDIDPARGEHGTLIGHVARANPIWRQRSSIQGVVIFQGPQAYITPSWYPAKQEHGRVVPTWNYAVVHAFGSPVFIPDRHWLLEHVSRLTSRHEASQATPWAVSDAPADYVEKMVGAIVGVEIPIAKLEGKWKMTLADIDRVKADFIAAAQRALAAGFKWLELHYAHGYLAQSFLSVHANKRTDAYGGDALRRGRFLEDTLSAVREVWPEHLPLDARLGVIEYDGRDEETLQEAIALAKRLKARGLDFLNISIGFSTKDGSPPWGPAFLAPVAARVRGEVGLPVAAAWGMDDPADAERAIATGQMDLVMMARAHLANPHCAYDLARVLGKDKPEWSTLPAPYAHWLERYHRPGKGGHR